MLCRLPVRVFLIATFALVCAVGFGCRSLEDRLISARPQIRAKALSELAELPPQDLEQLIQTLEETVHASPDLESKVFAVDALTEIGRPALPVITQLSVDQSFDSVLHKAMLDSFVSVGLLGCPPDELARNGLDAMVATTTVFDDTTRSIDVRDKASLALAAFGAPAVSILLERALRFDGPASELALRRTTELAQTDESAFNAVATRISEDVLGADEGRVDKSFAALTGLGDGALQVLIETAHKQGAASLVKLQKRFAASPDVYLPILIELIKDGDRDDFAMDTVVLIGKPAVPAVKDALISALGSDPTEKLKYTKVLHDLLRKDLGKEGRKALIEIMTEFKSSFGVTIAYQMVDAFLSRCHEKCVRQQNQGGGTINGVKPGAYVCEMLFKTTVGRTVAQARYGQHRVAYERGFVKSSDYDAIMSAHVNGIKVEVDYLCKGLPLPPDIAWKLYLMK